MHKIQTGHARGKGIGGWLIVSAYDNGQRVGNFRQSSLCNGNWPANFRREIHLKA